jgi:hypothetical protein
MAIPRWRIALTGGALVVLSATGIGLATAGTPLPAANSRDTVAPVTANAPLRVGGRHLVHGTVTVDEPGGGLETYQLDGGTISAIDADSISIAESGGATVTIAIDDKTRVRIDRHRAKAGDLKTGQRVVVVSRLADNGAATAKVIRVPPATR